MKRKLVLVRRKVQGEGLFVSLFLEVIELHAARAFKPGHDRVAFRANVKSHGCLPFSGENDSISSLRARRR